MVGDKWKYGRHYAYYIGVMFVIAMPDGVFTPACPITLTLLS